MKLLLHLLTSLHGPLETLLDVRDPFAIGVIADGSFRRFSSSHGKTHQLERCAAIWAVGVTERFTISKWL